MAIEYTLFNGYFGSEISSCWLILPRHINTPYWSAKHKRCTNYQSIICISELSLLYNYCPTVNLPRLLHVRSVSWPCCCFPALFHHPLSGLGRLVHILARLMLGQMLHITEKMFGQGREKVQDFNWDFHLRYTDSKSVFFLIPFMLRIPYTYYNSVCMHGNQ